MATKRQASDDTSSQRFFRKRHKPSYPNNKPANLGKKSFKKAHPVNDLKSTIRNLHRLLEYDEGLPANVRIEKERALKTAQQDLEQAQRAKKRSEIIGKWHKIRFFDRQKAKRRLKKARKEVRVLEEEDGEGDASGEVKRAKEEVKELEVDVNYAIYFPLDRDYVPLFPTRRKKGEGEEEGTPEEEGKRQGDLEMWERVKRCMKEGTLQDLREGGLEAGGVENAPQAVEQPRKAEKHDSKKAHEVSKESRKPHYKEEVNDDEDTENDDDENDDGKGFWEG